MYYKNNIIHIIFFFQIQLGWDRNCDVANCDYNSQMVASLLTCLLLLPALLLLTGPAHLLI